MATSRTSAYQAFTSAAASTNILEMRGIPRGGATYINIIVSGTFVGTVSLQESLPGANTYVDIPNASATTGFTTVVKVVAPGDFRWNCSAYTSGTINCSAEAQ